MRTLVRGFTWACIAAFVVMFWTAVCWILFKNPAYLEISSFTAQIAVCLMFTTAILHKLDERNAAKTP